MAMNNPIRKVVREVKSDAKKIANSLKQGIPGYGSDTDKLTRTTFKKGGSTKKKYATGGVTKNQTGYAANRGLAKKGGAMSKAMPKAKYGTMMKKGGAKKK